MATRKGTNGADEATNAVQRFEDYWARGKILRDQVNDPPLFIPEAYLPLKPDGTIHVGQVERDTGIGRAALNGQNPKVHDLYEEAKRITLAAHRKAVEARIASGTPSTSDSGSKSPAAPLLAPEAVLERLKAVERERDQLRGKLADLTVAHEKAQVRIAELEEQFAKNDFKFRTGMNPGPY